MNKILSELESLIMLCEKSNKNDGDTNYLDIINDLRKIKNRYKERLRK